MSDTPAPPGRLMPEERAIIRDQRTLGLIRPHEDADITDWGHVEPRNRSEHRSTTMREIADYRRSRQP